MAELSLEISNSVTDIFIDNLITIYGSPSTEGNMQFFCLILPKRQYI